MDRESYMHLFYLACCCEVCTCGGGPEASILNKHYLTELPSPVMGALGIHSQNALEIQCIVNCDRSPELRFSYLT